jgi:hypothetical protein
MATALELLKRLVGESSDGKNLGLELLPPLTDDEFRRLEKQIPCPIPEEARELFRYARGFSVHNPLLHGAHREFSVIDLSGLDAEFGLEQVFPHALSIADDGCGNSWVIDLTSDAKSWGPFFYACHDAPVVVYQADGLADFIEHAVRPASRSEMEAVHEELATRIWLENPGALTFEECADSKDEDMKAFAQALDASYQFIDLRTPKLGDGFSWGRYGPWTVNKRFGEKRLFAYQKKTKWERFKQFWKRG